ncbi:MAG TPA: SDR family NAD(P)-dependent oxidoreductase, partial [Vicinamibacteria bacterium]
MDAGIQDRCFLITGAPGGIGAETARAFGSEDAKLVLHYHQNRAGAETLAKDLSVPSLVVQADVASEADVDRMFKEILSVFPRLDGIVVNAGIWIADEVPLHAMSLKQWEK